MSTSKSPSKSPSRRVLGELAPRALNTPTKQTNPLDPCDGMRAYSPLKQVQTLSPQMLVGAENMYTAGRKRTIYEVDGVENLDKAGSMFGGRHAGFSRTGVSVTTAALQQHTGGVEIHLDSGSPTEINTPSPEPEPNVTRELPDNSQDTQASKESFSNYFDWNALDSQHTQHSDQPPVVESEKKSRAQLLRLRLGFGLYKVKTNQVSMRGSDIISNWETTSSLDRSLHPSTSAESSNSQPIPSITLSPARCEPAFVKANLDPFRPIGKLTPAPILLPTAVSSRMIHDYRMPSSPPQSIAPDQLMSPVRAESKLVTPVAKRMRTDEGERNDEGVGEKIDMEVEETIEERLQRMRERRFEEGDLTSSVVKGHAAKGLLELMTSGR